MHDGNALWVIYGVETAAVAVAVMCAIAGVLNGLVLAFAIAALGAKGDSFIRDAGCVAISYPDFFSLLDRIVASNYDVLTRRVRVPTWEKLWVLMRSVAV